MPGLRALVEDVEGTRRARIAAFYTSAFTIGAALSLLFGRAGTLWEETERREETGSESNYQYAASLVREAGLARCYEAVLAMLPK